MLSTSTKLSNQLKQQNFQQKLSNDWLKQLKIYMRLIIILIIVVLIILIVSTSHSNQIANNRKKGQLKLTNQFQNFVMYNTKHKPQGLHSQHKQQIFPYDTMGMKKNEKFNNTIIKQQDYYQFQESFYNLLKPYNDTNCVMQRIGNINDDGYPVCVNFLDSSKGMINLGIQGRDNFGCDLTSLKNMPNNMFDCTNAHMPACSTNNNNNVFTYACLGQRTQKVASQFYSLKDMIDVSGLKGKNYILKIDIEGGQWQGFKTFPIEYLKNADQILMQIHLPGPNLSWVTLRWGNIQIMKAIEENFISVYEHMNEVCCNSKILMQNKIRKIPAYAIEITFVNKRLIQLRSKSRQYSLKYRNFADQHLCDMQD